MMPVSVNYYVRLQRFNGLCTKTGYGLQFINGYQRAILLYVPHQLFNLLFAENIQTSQFFIRSVVNIQRSSVA